jgi:type II secretory pathway predicted ATPase ExeA
MYLSFYGLKQKPFQMSTNPSFIWLGKLHKKVLTMLQYGILQNQGFFLLSGDVGTGKTTLVNELINSLGDDVLVARVPDPGLDLIDFLNYISHAFGMDKRFVCKEDFLIQFERFLQSNAAAGKKVLLIIDEAQRLNAALLEEIRQLSNIEKQQTKALNILFAGQNLFNDFLQESQNRALSQRIAINAAIGPLDFDETAEYIRQSLKIAGAKKDIFSADALRSIGDFSGGFLRRINILCDHAMLLGYLQGKKTVTVDMVRQCAEDLCLPDATAQLTPDLVHGVSGYDGESLQDIPPQSVPVIAPIQAWKIIGTVILIVIGVFAATYFNYPQEYRTLFSRIQKNGLQVLRLSQETDLINNPVTIQHKVEPLQEAVIRDASDATAAIHTIDTVNVDAMQSIDDNSIDEAYVPSVQINALSFAEQQMSKEADVSESISVLTDDMPVPYTKAEAGDEGSEVFEVSEVSETRETLAPEEISAESVESFVAEEETTATDPDPAGASQETVSTVYAELVESMMEQMTDDMPGAAVDPVDPAEPEEVKEAAGVVVEPPADVDPRAVIDWVIKKRSE